ncbi:Na(+)-translocating NADH-quinone reductase subunit C [Rhodopirellula sp. MGV]|uniref:Na(+)-translocating NADH-quinone reductase subunit C n=1 Tax=Rhodopirellula sp. MGV TaxID=2023130 RepID=UPI000B95E042|nr:Na(+)-translocating NADH-quinone reductase subunit C [Rhodopirellula sp. MGV]OYP33147.1 Na(+)-translocating NADH-quinone reductase subunit C [Rhodopirellula sp. MGV]PNY35124.1 Na(+)-translocating NADH-quinone reductase subunit C [Rhodopirellula baltica]
MPQRDSMIGTLLAATVLCVVCSAVVSVAAVGLREKQEQNKVLDRQKNILDATGLARGEYGLPAAELSKEQIDELSSWISEKLVDLETGEYVTDMDPAKYDPREAAEKPDTSVAITDVKYDPGVDRREKIAKVYLVKKPGSEGEFQQVVLPVYGKGLWSTLYGFLALRSDLETIQGLTFYQHAETPGLGGEVDNPAWKAQWEGQKLYDEAGEPAAIVAKGPAPSGSMYAVDGLSGATITSRGVTTLLRYWSSDDGYGKFIKNLNEQHAAKSGS